MNSPGAWLFSEAVAPVATIPKVVVRVGDPAIVPGEPMRIAAFPASMILKAPVTPTVLRVATLEFPAPLSKVAKGEAAGEVPKVTPVTKVPLALNKLIASPPVPRPGPL